MIDSLDYRLHSDTHAIHKIILEEGSLEDADSEIKALLNLKSNTDQGAYKIWFEGNDEQITSDENIDSLLSQIIKTNPVIQWEDGIFATNLIYNEEPLRVIWARDPIRFEGATSTQELNVFVSISASYAHHEMAEFLKALLIIAGVVIWTGIGGLFAVLRWGLRPLEQMAEKMEQVFGHPLKDSVMNTADTVKELHPFVTSWSRMLKRLSISMEENKRFTADASHELRTPLAVIKSTLQLARSQKRTSEFYEKAIDESLEDINRMNLLIDKLLELSRLDYLLPPETFKSIDMEQLIEGLITQYEPVARNHGKTLQKTLCQAQIEGDEVQLGQMLVNLLHNAIRYSPEKSTLSVNMQKTETYLKVIVHDEGGAITPQEQFQIFDRFYRIDKSRNRNSGGTGLGLSIAYEIAQRHDGTITVSSSPGIGTDFTISLPVSRHQSL
jgi:signal transduction histidine kinase